MHLKIQFKVRRKGGMLLLNHTVQDFYFHYLKALWCREIAHCLSTCYYVILVQFRLHGITI